MEWVKKVEVASVDGSITRMQYGIWDKNNRNNKAGIVF